MRTTTRTKLIAILANLDSGDIDDVYALVKEAQGRLARDMVQSLNVGNTVTFRGRRNEYLTGVIQRLNQSTATVKVDKPTRFGSPFSIWRVNASILKRV